MSLQFDANLNCNVCGNRSHVASSLFYTNSKQEFAVWYEPFHDPMIDSDTEGYKKFGGPFAKYRASTGKSGGKYKESKIT